MEHRMSATISSSNGQVPIQGRAASHASRHSKPVSLLLPILYSTLTILLWMFFSLAVIIYNKKLFDLGFRFPLAVTGMGQLFSSVGGVLLSLITAMPIRPVPSKHFLVTKIAPVSVSFAACLFLGNYAFLRLPVSFMQMLKSFTPAVMLTMCVWTGSERWSFPLVFSILTITFGTGSSVMIEGGKDDFHMIGFLCFFFSTFAEAARTVLSEKLLSAERYNTAQVLVYVGGLTGAFLLVSSAVWEGHEIAGVGFMLVRQHLGLFMAAFSLGCGVNLANYLALEYTSPLTFKVVGCVKNTVAVIGGMILYGDDVTATQMLGYFISMAGFIWYLLVKMGQLKARQQAAAHTKKE